MDESSLYLLLDGAGDASFVVDQGGVIRYWSDKAEQLLGLRRETAIGNCCADVLGGIDEFGSPRCSRLCRVIGAATRGEAVCAFDVRYATASGDYRWVNVGVMTVRANRGRTSLIVHFVRDIDPRKQMELITRDILVSVGRLTGRQADSILQKAREPTPSNALSARETAILHGLSEGLDVQQIAAKNFISTVTVRNHIQHILTKLQCHSRLDAVVRAIREGII